MDKGILKLDWCSHEAAKYAVEHWHYSEKLPRASLTKIGVWENEVFKGCIIFSMGANNDLVRQYGLKPWQGCELTRIAMTDHQVSVSRICSIAIKFLKNKCPKLELIVSFADPRRGHHGGVYQAMGWIYSGICDGANFAVVRGKHIHARTVFQWIKSGRIKKRSDIPHEKPPGKHRYLFPLNEQMRKRIIHLSKPYPKRATSDPATRQPPQAGKGGAAPTVALSSQSNPIAPTLRPERV